MHCQVSFSRILSGTFLISGTMIGAGMLGIPLITGTTGFFPASIITFFVWLFMYATGLLFLEVTLWMPDGSNVLSISSHFFGRSGKYFSGGMFIFLYYCLMVAYFAAGAPLLAEVFLFVGISFRGFEAFLVFGFIFGTIVAIGPKSIDRVNIIISVAMIGSWLVLIGSGGSQVKSSQLAYTYWPSMVFAMPVLFSAFGFHNIIPSLCTYLKRDRKALRISIFWGSFLPFLVYIVWQWLIIGAIPVAVISETLKAGLPVTAAFESITGAAYFVATGRFFAFFAIVTSVLGVAFSMVDFFGDGFRIPHRKGWKRIGLTFLTFIPPFIFVIFNPDIFSKALSLAGGFGEAFLNGILPAGLMWSGKYFWKFKTDLKFLGSRWLLALLFVYALFVIALEAIQLFS